MNIYLDDCRPAPEGYRLVKTARECIEALAAGGVKYLSLDHDLGDACAKCWREWRPRWSWKRPRSRPARSPWCGSSSSAASCCRKARAPRTFAIELY